MKQKFNIINSTCVPLPLENVDTDQIIPARFLKATTKEGFGENLFRDWRYDKQGNKIESFGLDVTNKEDAIRKICKMMYDAGKVSSYEDYLQGVKDRELEFETGMGNGIAIPHCKGGCVKEAAFTLVKLNQKIEWGSLDGEPVDYVIMLAAPNTADNVHLKMLSSLAVGLMDDDFREALKDATDVDQIIDIFKSKKEE